MKAVMNLKILTVVLMAALMSLTACSKKGDSGDGLASTPYGLQNCAGCAGMNAQTILSQTLTSPSGMSQANIQLLGDAMGLQQAQYASQGTGSHPAVYYVGRVALSGTIQIQGFSLTCGQYMPPGTYQIYTVAPGQKTSVAAYFQVQQAMMVGPTQVPIAFEGDLMYQSSGRLMSTIYFSNCPGDPGISLQ